MIKRRPPKLVTLAIRLPESLLAKIVALAKKTEVTKSYCAWQALEKAFEKEKK